MGKPQATSSNIWTYATHGDVANLQRLLEEGEEPNLQNKLGESAAHLAAKFGHAQALILLGKHHGDVSLADSQGRTPAHAAAAAGQLDCLRALAGPLGARLDTKDKEGKKPLDVAKGDAVRKFLSNWMAEAKASRRGQAPAAALPAGAAGARLRQQPKQQQQQAPWRGSQQQVTGQAAGKGGYGSDSDEAAGAGQQQQQQQRRAGNDYHSSRDVEQQQQGVEEGARGHKAVPSTEPLCYVPLQCVGSGPACMPRCTLEEVGFTPEGLSLGMPKRPAWRGIVRTAPQLHALEEQSFAAWQQSLQDKQKQLPISFYEPRLEFWRQLWRVLELSDIVIMIVDARNPLLHFSHALTCHVLEDHGATPLLVLNKCDLVPLEAVHAWREFFEGRYPGLKVVASSTRGSGAPAAAAGAAPGAAAAAPGALQASAGSHEHISDIGSMNHSAAAAAPAAAAPLDGRTGAAGSVARGTAAAVLEALLECTVQRPGKGSIKVADIVGLDVDSILEEAKRRNTLAKRATAASASAIRQAAAAPAAAAAAAATKSGGRQGLGLAAAGLRGSEDEGSEGGGWDVKGTKASKKQAVKKKRTLRMGTQQQPQQQQQQVQQGRLRQQHGGGQGRLLPAVVHTKHSAGKLQHQGFTQQQQQQQQDISIDDEAVGNLDQSSGQEEVAAEAGSGSEAEAGSHDSDSVASEGSDSGSNGHYDDDDDDDDADQQQQEDELLQQEERELQGSYPEDDQQQQQQQEQQGKQERWRQQHGREQPVVVCVVGEPNVGKSSTLNALLGTHRVAVSCHPGRTKHYQTHYMTDSLMLCDCPGLVFPRAGVSLPMQVLYGSYPIARCKDPYSVVRYLAERIYPRLHVALGLRRPAGQGVGQPPAPLTTSRRGATGAATPTVTSAATGAATRPATSTATGAATGSAINAATGSARGSATSAATGAEGATAAAGELLPARPCRDVHAAAAALQGGPCDQDEEEVWSTADLLEAIAARKSWQSRHGRLDVYRAANWVLRNALAGRPGTCLAFLPPPPQ